MNFQRLKLDWRHSSVSRISRAVAVVSIPVLLALGCSATQTLPSWHAAASFRKEAPYNRPYRVKGKKYYPITNPEGYKERGLASWYGAESGNRTAMGARFNPKGLSAAHKTLPLPCKVKVTNLKNRRSVVVIINDRGPFVKNRLIDLSQGAAQVLGIRGLAEVEVEYVEDRAMSE